jgi:hypothetical protein
MGILWMKKKLGDGNQIKTSFRCVCAITLALVPINNEEVIIKEILFVLALACVHYDSKIKSTSGIVSNAFNQITNLEFHLYL